jgi:hypothetical protein
MATAQEFEITESEIAGAGSYDELETPGDYEAVLFAVEDYDKRAEGRSYGWIWTFHVEGLPFKEYTSFSPAARWKLVELLQAFGVEVDAGINTVDPDAFVGTAIGATVDWDPTDDKWDGTSPRYRRLARFFQLVDLEDVAPL